MVDSASHRAAERKSWPVRKFRLGQEPSDDISADTTPLERLLMMWPLAREAWKVAGRNLPDYSRNQTPVKLLRGKPS